jgi:hypothetical protein
MRAFSPSEEHLLKSVGGFGTELRKHVQKNVGLLAEDWLL